MAGVVHMEPFENSVPDFIDFFWPTIDQREKRIWILNLINDGLNKKGDIKTLFYYHAIDFILSSMVNANGFYYLRLVNFYTEEDPNRLTSN